MTIDSDTTGRYSLLRRSLAADDNAIPILAQMLTIALLGGGAFGAVTSFFLMKGAWPWPMPDLAYRFLAGAATAYAIGSLITLVQPSWARSELLLATVILYGIPLGLAILIEPGPVDWDRPVAWGFVGLVIPALVISITSIWQQRDRLGHDPGRPLLQPLRLILGGLGVLAGTIGLLVYLVPRESGTVWPWAELGPWKPLDSRLLASMLITIGGGALLVAWRNRRAMVDVFLPMLWGYCVVTSVGLALHADDTPALRTEDLAYIAIFAVLVVVTGALYLAQRRTTDSRP